MLNISTLSSTKSKNSPSQLGFGFEVMDAEGRTPDFLYKEEDVREALHLIRQAAWVSVDVETTGLTEASVPVSLGVKDLRHGSSNVVRMRTIQARIPMVEGRRGDRENFAFDADKLGTALTQEVAEVLLTRRMLIAHNAGFDLYWLRRAQGRAVMPEIVADTMLLTRLLEPKVVLKRTEMIKDIGATSAVPLADEEEKAAWNSLLSGASGASLADVVLAMFGRVVDKTYQKPGNWAGLLGFEHYEYAIDDVIWADRILCKLLGVAVDSGDLLQAYLEARESKILGERIRLIEPQVPDLVRLREAGMPMNTDVALRYAALKEQEMATHVQALVEIEPRLELHRDALLDPNAGTTADLKRTLSHAFEVRGVKLRKTLATNTPQIGEKDLRACQAGKIEEARPLFDAWVALCKAKKVRQMALETIGFATRSDDGRLHSLLSHGPVTGRLSASEPNCFTGDTEILTPEGWVRFDALRDDQKVAQYSNGAISFVQPTAHIREHWAGNLVRNRLPGRMDLLTTPGHRCLVVDVDDENPRSERVVAAQDYPENAYQLHAGQYVGGEGLSLSDDEIRFLVAAQSAARWDNKGGLVFSFKKTKKVGTFRRLKDLQAMCGPLLSGTNVYRQNHVRYVRFSRRNALVKVASRYLGVALQFGSWVLTLDRRQLSVFTRAAALWGGDAEEYDRYTRSRKECSYHTFNLHNAQWLQIAYSLTGNTAILTPMRDKVRQSGWRVVVKPLIASKTTGRKQTLVPYSGMVYCVSVDSGFIVVRRKGFVAITGQCQQWPRDQLFRAMCMSGVEKGKETLELEITASNRELVARCLGMDAQGVAVGSTVPVDTCWFTALFYSDSSVHAWPKDEYTKTRSLVDDAFTHVIVASDFGALDVRVGAALCIRAQREMLDVVKGHAVPGPTQPSDEILSIIRDVAGCLDKEEVLVALANQEKLHAIKAKRVKDRMEALTTDWANERVGKTKYWTLRAELKTEMIAAKLGWRLAQCLRLATERGEKDYSALRDAFVADIDIHTFTGMKLMGRDPMKEFEGLEPAQRKEMEKTLKKELGPRRQQGKIANLSLLYGMADKGFQEAAARGYNEHWTLEESAKIRRLWMDAYPEVELWHLWTECLQAGVVPVPEKGREKPARTPWWMARTLSGREIVAFGLNAALSYQDQSSGADILGLIMHRLQTEHPEIFATSINQVHDEQVFCFPKHKAKEYLEIVEKVMVAAGNSQTMPYGVPTAVSPACGPLWVKD